MNDKIRYFFPKLKNRLSAERVRIYENISIERYSLRGIDDCGGKDGFVKRLHCILGYDIIGVIRNSSDIEIIKCAADKTCNHVFDLLGSGAVTLHPINWNKEFKTGFEWPTGVFYTKLRALTPQGSDIKMPWELSRCHHLLWLSEAYLITGEEKYAKEVVDELNNWIDNNPFMYTVNWTCSMDVAIRAINWMYALLFVEKSGCFDDNFSDKVYKSLFQHAFFIKNNLEKCIPYSNNHYVSDIVGLLYLGAFFSTNSKGRKILKFAKREYIKETLVEVLSSGINYEKSVSYHRLMTELLVYSRCLLVRIGEELPKEVDERLARMLEYVGHYSVNSSSPIVGDNDNGRLLPFVPRNFKNHTYLIDSNSLEWKVVNNGIKPLAINSVFTDSKVFTDANVAILKKGSKYVFVGCCSRWKFDKETDKFSGTHLHNDLLSFIYCDNGKEIIVDPGAYCYTSDLRRRNEFRSTKKHNTIMVDDEEQNFLDTSSAFGMKYNNREKPLILSDDGNVCCLGEYETINGKMLHQRTFRLDGGEFEITDTISKRGKEHTLYMSFHFAKNVEAWLKGKDVDLKIGSKHYRMCIESSTQFSLSLIDDTISPSFGVLEDSNTLIVQALFNECISIKTKIIDYEY